MTAPRRAYRVEDPRRLRDEADMEIRFHFEERVEELVSTGMSREDAVSEIRRRFGDPERVVSEVAAIDRRGCRRRSALDHLRDCLDAIRYTLRGMLARPG